MAHQRRWLAAAAIGIGIGAAMAIGCGVASADAGSSGASSSRSADSASPQGSTTSAGKSAATAKSARSKPATALRAQGGTDRRPSVTATVKDTKTVDTLAVPTTAAAVTATATATTTTVAVEATDVTEAAAPVETVPAAQTRSAPRSSARSDGAPAVRARARAVAASAVGDGVTGVKVGHSDLYIPIGTDESYTAAADWYFPTQADGTVNAQGVIYLQHGFFGFKSWYSALATQLALQTNSVVVAPNVPWFQFPWDCTGCLLSGAPMAEGVAGLFADPDRTWLTASANAAGYVGGPLPQDFVLTGHSAGGGLAATAGGFYNQAVPSGDNHLKGVVMYDGVSSSATFADSLAKLGDIPVYQIAAPPQPWNANGQTTTDLVALRPDQFVGDVLANGSHVDSLIGGNLLADIASQLLVKCSPAGNTQAVYTLATGWINDFYAGNTPTTPGPTYGIYGDPDQYIVMGPTAAVVLGPPPVVDVNDYSGLWYEVGSVKQFFSIGLVNTTAVYTPLLDGSIKVENSGNYFVNNGPQSTIVGNAVSLNVDNNKLNVSFLGPASATPPGNYWIVDLAPDYSWAIVSDSTGGTGFLLSRTPTVSDALYQELLNRASVKGVNRWITPTRQPQAASTGGAASTLAGLAA